MSAQPAILREPTILDHGENRFPLDLGVRIPRIRNLFHSATKNQWDPRSDIDWHLLDLSKYTDEQLMGAREYWSRRAWGEYGAISESPALLIRFCQDRLEPDLQLFFTIRSQEEARHAEVCYLLAEKLGGYIEQPIVVDYEASVATHGIRKMALDPGFSLPAIMRDEVRHCAFGWYFMEHKIKALDPGEMKEVENALITMIEKVEMNGYHSAWLAPDNPASTAEVNADRLTWEAGLGATVEELEKPVFVASIQRIRRQVKPWGVDLPIFEHPKIGKF